MVALDGEIDAVGDKGRGVSEEVDVLVDLLDDFEGEFADEGTVGDEEDGDFLVAAAHGAKDLQRGASDRTGCRPSRSQSSRIALCDGSDMASARPSSGVDVRTTS